MTMGRAKQSPQNSFDKALEEKGDELYIDTSLD